MNNNQSTSNNNIHQEDKEYKHKSCAGLRCNNIPIHYLKLAVIKRSGWFCKNCSQDLQKDGLVESILKESRITGDEDNFE